MIRQCLICDSRAVLTQEAARGVALLAGLADGALRGVQDTNQGTQDRLGYNSLLSGLAAIAPTYPSALRLAEDVAKYHFAGEDCLCLRCGALFDEAVKEASEQAPQPQ
ncbi:hypothetical protein QN404_04515 [Pseudomonas sp. RTS1]|uniref:hypothetical protein n=1 Tax=unclassified Pseudomonas TaxID=196821 RepID=UPI002B2351C5|nr:MULTISPECIES: hypothetical protein [unclassified Pseudomonas]MEA9988154.1 hypothetical protein [Pseudomonas sp. RTS1]MEB0033862.1 hypothetical protein [Pseudomonas sp. RTS2]MEB0234080.1 hypothetical protein [Pseudomonas sp. 5S3]MEB0255390.1 hypothetical protein [Pseudomonas sp. 5S2]